MSNISPYKTDLDKSNALEMAYLSKLVYEKTSEDNELPNKKSILEVLKKRDKNYLNVKGYDKNSAQAMIVDHKEFIVVSFRGTNELSDWIDNINAFPEKVLFGDFHRGFWNSVKDLWDGEDGIFADYQALRETKKRPLFLTGHSLGGAMASIAAARLIHQDKPFTSVYTFGQPRSMSRETARIFNAEASTRVHRFQNNEDIVTRAPSRMMNYSHVGRCFYIDADNKIHQNPGMWYRFVDMIDGAVDSLKDIGRLGAITDHSIDNYLAAIKHWDLVD